jgi:hypothetical protein
MPTEKEIEAATEALMENGILDAAHLANEVLIAAEVARGLRPKQYHLRAGTVRYGLGDPVKKS